MAPTLITLMQTTNSMSLSPTSRRERGHSFAKSFEGFAKDEDILAHVAAGPFENLLARHPHAFIDHIEDLAQNDAHFRRAVSGVWGWTASPRTSGRAWTDYLETSHACNRAVWPASHGSHHRSARRERRHSLLTPESLRLLQPWA